jgi:hypothetical protein
VAEQSLLSHILLGLGAGGAARGEDATAATASSGPAADATTEEDAGPPYAIMEHVPLAVLVNGVLAALNELRHCAILSISKPLAE